MHSVSTIRSDIDHVSIDIGQIAFFRTVFLCLYAGRWQLRARGFPVNRAGTRCMRTELLRNYVSRVNHNQVTSQLNPKKSFEQRKPFSGSFQHLRKHVVRDTD